jgi:hypothetical protein
MLRECYEFVKFEMQKNAEKKIPEQLTGILSGIFI